MSIDITDLRPTIIPKSDQLNAEQLLAGPMTVTISDVRAGSSDEQPITIHYEGENGRPYKPCKTMRKVMIFAWGVDGMQWIGKSMTLYCDPNVKFGGDKVGGIRISHLSDIPKPLSVSLTATRGKKSLYEIQPLQIERGPSLAEVLAAIKAAHNKATLDAAKTLATKLRGADDVQQAQASYRARVAEIKAGATDPLPGWIAKIEGATDAETASMVLDEARDVLTPEQHFKLCNAYADKWEQGA